MQNVKTGTNFLVLNMSVCSVLVTNLIIHTVNGKPRSTMTTFRGKSYTQKYRKFDKKIHVWRKRQFFKYNYRVQIDTRSNLTNVKLRNIQLKIL